MTTIINRIKSGSGAQPLRILLAGPEGVGKSTFASKAPAPVFIAAEDGLTGLDHVQRFTPASLGELNEMLEELAKPTPFKTVVIDTTDWLERLIGTSICARDKKTDIEDYGYGKGYVVLEGELVKILAKLDTIRHAQAMGIILLSHVQIRPFNDPRGESWDRYEMKGHKRFTGILREWPDACLFAVYEVFQTEKGGKKNTIGGERIVHTEWSPAWDAKNRLNLPPTIPLDWDEFQAAVDANAPLKLRESVRSLFATAKFNNGDKPKWEKAMTGLETMTADRLKSAIEKLSTLQ